MEPYLCVCMSCGLYMKCSTPMIPEKHMCNPNNKAIEKNIKECRAILDTLLGSGNSGIISKKNKCLKQWYFI